MAADTPPSPVEKKNPPAPGADSPTSTTDPAGRDAQVKRDVAAGTKADPSKLLGDSYGAPPASKPGKADTADATARPPEKAPLPAVPPAAAPEVVPVSTAVVVPPADKTPALPAVAAAPDAIPLVPAAITPAENLFAPAPALSLLPTDVGNIGTTNLSLTSGLNTNLDAAPNLPALVPPTLAPLDGSLGLNLDSVAAPDLNTKLQAGSFSGSLIDWSKPPSTDLTALELGDIYNFSGTSNLSPGASTQPFNLDFNSFQNPGANFGFKYPGLDLYSSNLGAFDSVNTFSNTQFADNMWSTNFTDKLSSTTTKTFDKLFSTDAKTGTAGAATVADAGPDAATKALLASHKDGESWTSNGVNFYKTKDGGVVSQDATGDHYVAADGTRYDGNGKDATITKDGDVITKVGDQYFKQYPGGDKIEIHDQGEIKAIVRLEGLVVEQRVHALERLGPAVLAAAVARGSRTVVGPDGTQVYKVDADGDLVAKSSKEPGSFVRMKDGDVYHVNDGKVYKVGPDGQETLVPDSNLPDKLKRGPNGDIKIGTVTLSAANGYCDTEHNQCMADLTPKVTADTSKGPLVVAAANGQESIKTPDHDYEYNPAANDKGGTYTVYNNSDHSVDLTYDYSTKTLNTDGITWDPQGCQMGDVFIGADNSISDDGNQIFASDYTAYTTDRAEDEAASVQDELTAETQSAASTFSEVAGELNTGTIDAGDVSEVGHDLALLNAIDTSRLSSTAIANLGAAKDTLSSALPVVEEQAREAELINHLTGIQSPALTKEILAEGGGTAVADLVMKRWGLLPLEIVDNQVA